MRHINGTGLMRHIKHTKSDKKGRSGKQEWQAGRQCTYEPYEGGHEGAVHVRAIFLLAWLVHRILTNGPGWGQGAFQGRGGNTEV